MDFKKYANIGFFQAGSLSFLCKMNIVLTHGNHFNSD